MKHYFTNNEDMKSNPKRIKFNFDDHELEFITDIGVFSKDAIDYGSRSLLNNIKSDDIKESLLDVGCGYGALGISLQKKYNMNQVLMVDVNPRSVELTIKNIELNQCSHIEAKISDGYEQVNSQFDLIITNPPIRAGKVVVHRIIGEAIHYLNDKGTLYVVIQKKQGAQSAIKLMEDVYGNVEILNRDKGYYTLRSKKE